jgi:hypothetical protein
MRHAGPGTDGLEHLHNVSRINYGVKQTVAYPFRGRQYRHRTLGAMIDWNYETLSDEERLVLRWLAVFRGVGAMRLAVAGKHEGSLMRCHAETSQHFRPESRNIVRRVALIPQTRSEIIVVRATRDRSDLGLMDNTLDTSRRSRLPANASQSRPPVRPHWFRNSPPVRLW